MHHISIFWARGVLAALMVAVLSLVPVSSPTPAWATGETWSPHSAAEANDWVSVAYGNGVWVAVANTGTTPVMRSTDGGLTWTGVTVPEPNVWMSVAYGNGVWVAVARSGTNRVMRSTDDGLTWTAVAAAEDVNEWYSVA